MGESEELTRYTHAYIIAFRQTACGAARVDFGAAEAGILVLA